MADLAPYLGRAKAALRDRLRQHEDEGVRLLADTVDLPDHDPRVQSIAISMRLQDRGFS